MGLLLNDNDGVFMETRSQYVKRGRDTRHKPERGGGSQVKVCSTVG